MACCFSASVCYRGDAELLAWLKRVVLNDDTTFSRCGANTHNANDHLRENASPSPPAGWLTYRNKPLPHWRRNFQILYLVAKNLNGQIQFDLSQQKSQLFDALIVMVTPSAVSGSSCKGGRSRPSPASPHCPFFCEEFLYIKTNWPLFVTPGP